MYVCTVCMYVCMYCMYIHILVIFIFLAEPGSPLFCRTIFEPLETPEEASRYVMQ